MIIAFDADDTIENLSFAWVDWLNNKYGTNVKREELTDWDTAKFFPELTREQVFEPLSLDEFWDTVKPYSDAQEIISRLQEEGDEVYIVTSSNYKSFAAKAEKVILNNFSVDWEHVIVTYNKQIIKADVLVDDGVHNLVGGDYFKILMDAPYNQGNYEGLNIHRAYNFDDVYDFIRMARIRFEGIRCVGVNHTAKKMRNDLFTEGD